MPHCQACDRSESATEALVARGARLTELRRDVLAELHHAQKPVGAYDLFERLKSDGKASAPPAVYRVLDFLVEQGLVHKLQSLSAYAACPNAVTPHEAFFLICRKCGSVAERETSALAHLTAAAEKSGFAPEHLVVEATGICAACQGQPTA